MPDPFSAFDYLADGDAEGGKDAASRHVARLFVAFLYTSVTVAITDLGIPVVLAGAGKALTAAEVAAGTGTDPDATARLLKAGTAVGLVSEDADGRFTLTDPGNHLRPGRVGDLTGFWAKPILQTIGALADHVRTGRRVNPAEPGGFWDYLGSHPEEAARFSGAMGHATSCLLAALTEAGYRPPSSQRIVDVGGNRGTLLAWFLKAVPGATGVVFDRPESLAAAPGYLASAGVADRADLVEGSFLTEVPDGDLHLLSQVLHNWDDENVRLIAVNCARAARPGGWLVVIEYVLPTGPEPSAGHMIDMIMMTLFGGRERTLEEHRALIEPAGYTFARGGPVGNHAGWQPPWSVLEFRRN
jgi:SAM-dependent methyltransferase